MGLSGIIIKEFKHIFRDFRTLLVLFVLPISQMIIFGYAMDLQIKNINIKITDEVLAERRTKMDAKGKNAWKPVQRERHVSPALRAYAAMSTSAAFGAVRNVEQIERN